jgi:hypothetical protein
MVGNMDYALGRAQEQNLELLRQPIASIILKFTG